MSVSLARRMDERQRPYARAYGRYLAITYPPQGYFVFACPLYARSSSKVLGIIRIKPGYPALQANSLPAESDLIGQTLNNVHLLFGWYTRYRNSLISYVSLEFLAS